MKHRQQKKKTLNDLMRETPKTEAEWRAVWERAGHSDRGATIISATIVEDMLKYSLGQILHVPADDHEGLFGLRAPLNSFDAKIRMGFALRLYGPVARHDLDVIRKIRNAFAHSAMPISFATEPVIEMCKTLRFRKRPLSPQEQGMMVAIYGPNNPPQKRLGVDDPEGNFFATCREIGMTMIAYAADMSSRINDPTARAIFFSKMP